VSFPGINPNQAKLLEILASSGLNTASIFFALVAILYGALQTTQIPLQQKPLRLGIVISFAGVLVSLAFTAIALSAVRYQTPGWYRAAIVSAIITMCGIVVAAAYVLREGVVKKAKRNVTAG
jgi:energy-converting hydrogenase Eha subunit B